MPFSSDTDFFSESNYSGGRKSRRFTERWETSLPVRVRGRETPQEEWAETGRLVDASRSGARLRLSHRIEAGQLIHLTTPIPSSLRAFDQTEKDYCVYAVIRSVTALPMAEAGKPQYEIGVAFIGKTPPGSFKLNPRTRYETLPAPNREGMWMVREMPRHSE